jgi:hypothetical protein
MLVKAVRCNRERMFAKSRVQRGRKVNLPASHRCLFL